ncbi:chemotaxis protein CheW [Endozoicomonas sp. SCSIO W0465]|uniref:chemotaxis protein CheW n=1 Tax=Endozoicomonas sp. SCSIO W0465 TaxID=2918516 RepID=UPI0020750124|nr:chemotaxis protein CheW [Endozoicomonas sp. SCSIO W0465]USE36747.1 chemotaxis protein CheW [Endozoicomonas sp. SCSIO W0465]
MQQRPLLIPSACIADIENYSRPEPNYPEAEWLLGDLNWRGAKIPVVSFERLNRGRFAEFSATNRIAVMHRTSKNNRLPFYAMVVQGVPQPLTLVREEVRSATDETGPMEKYRVLLREVPASIPDLYLLEQKINEVISGYKHEVVQETGEMSE